MPRYKLVIAYDGTAYGGWQSQTNSCCIQDMIQGALSTILRSKTVICGSGRTDAGVHATGQVAHFDTERDIDPGKIGYSLNCLLPKDIRIVDIKPVKDSFHARYSVKKKIYQYRLHLDPICDPFKRKYTYHVRHLLDIEEMKKASKHLIGTHDFSSFANQQHEGSAAKDPVRTIFRIDFIAEPGGIMLEFEGNGFLYKMVRNITGTLLEVGGKQRISEHIPKILQAKDRRAAGKAAAAQGLQLAEVIYACDSSALNDG